MTLRLSALRSLKKEMIMHILRYLVLLTVFFGLAYVVYQYMGEENVQPTEEDVQSIKASALFAQNPEVFVQLGHSGTVNAVAFSPNGKWALSGSDDKTLKLWKVETGREIRTLTGHTDDVYAVAFSPDGKRALSGSGDNTLKLWDTEMGREIRTWTGHIDDVYAVAFSPDGKRALSGSGIARSNYGMSKRAAKFAL
jgi:predicted NACHT family NTPase